MSKELWTHPGVNGALSPVSGPSLLVEAVGHVEGGGVVVPQLRAHPLCLDAMQQGGPKKINLKPQIILH